MGLDMYLKANRNLGRWQHFKPEIIEATDRVLRAADIEPSMVDEGGPSVDLSFTIGYWRKANAIHAWFVKHVQDGVDDCQDAWVSREKLVELRNACQHVLGTIETVPGKVGEGTTFYGDGRVEHHTRDGEVVAQTGMAAAVLPTQGGFFFGKTDYDEDYLTDLRETVAIIDRALSLPDCWTFEYHSSW